ncbi:MAG: DUF58 domain-containing protein, partial [Gemmataceae bacterium]|nr:DUF58 domain-containing protein [Gemmataceae bacterium]
MSHPPAVPSTAPSTRGRVRLTEEGLYWLGAAAVLGGVGWFKSLNVVLVLAYGMAALLVLNGLLARAQVRRVTAARLPVPPVHAGQSARVRARLWNRSDRPAAAVAVHLAGRDWLAEALPAGGEIEAGGAAAIPRRGRHRLPPAVVWSGYPFGLARYDRPAGEPGEVVVLPAVGEIDPDGLRRWLARAAGGDDRHRRVLRRATADQADVRGVRPYRPGDSLRWVHWRSSARRRELMVREYDAAPAPDLLVVVEPWLPAGASAADHDRLEAALSLAATVARGWARLDGRVALVVLGGDGPRPVPPGAGGGDGLVPLADARGAES